MRNPGLPPLVCLDRAKAHLAEAERMRKQKPLHWPQFVTTNLRRAVGYAEAIISRANTPEPASKGWAIGPTFARLYREQAIELKDDAQALIDAARTLAAKTGRKID